MLSLSDDWWILLFERLHDHLQSKDVSWLGKGFRLLNNLHFSSANLVNCIWLSYLTLYSEVMRFSYRCLIKVSDCDSYMWYIQLQLIWLSGYIILMAIPLQMDSNSSTVLAAPQFLFQLCRALPFPFWVNAHTLKWGFASFHSLFSLEMLSKCGDQTMSSFLDLPSAFLQETNDVCFDEFSSC